MSSFQRLFSIETRLLCSQRFSIGYLLTCFTFCGITTLLMEHAIVGAEKGWVADLQRNLWIRNWMLLPLGYCWLSIQTFVNSRDQGFVQDAIVAGYSRTEILCTKLSSLLVISLLSLIAILIPTLPYIDSGEWTTTMGGWFLTLLSDCILIGWVALFSLSAKSSNRVLLNMGLLVGLDFMIRVGLWLGSSITDNPTLDWMSEYIPMLLPSSAINCWMLWEEAWSIPTLLVAVGYAIGLWSTVYNRWQKMVF